MDDNRIPIENLDTEELLTSKPPEELTVYLACPLSHLSEDDRDRVGFMRQTVHQACAAITAVRIAVHDPYVESGPQTHPEMSSDDVYRLDQEKVANADVVIAIVDSPSAGAAI